MHPHDHAMPWLVHPHERRVPAGGYAAGAQRGDGPRQGSTQRDIRVRLEAVPVTGSEAAVGPGRS